MTDAAWIGAALTAARPQAMAALLRYFRNLDIAEEAFQEACLRALRTWPEKGPPRDAAAWIIMVARNAGVDHTRKQSRLTALPPEDQISDTGDQQTSLAERIDDSEYRDDLLRLMFICCHPDLPATQQIALALRIVSGLSVAQIARAFLVGEAAMEQRITRAKAKVAGAGVAYEAPGAPDRVERLAAVAAMLYLVFNEGYSAPADPDRAALCEEAIRLTRLLQRMFPAEAEIMGLLALMLIQQSRMAARVGEDGEIVLLDDQDRGLWDRQKIGEAMALIEKGMRQGQPGPYLIQAGIASLHARAKAPEDTDWAQIDRFYALLETVQPSPVVTLNRAVAVSKASGPDDALTLIEPLGAQLEGYFHFHGVRAGLLMQLGRMGEAREAFNRAIALARTPQEAAHIRARLDEIEAGGRKPVGKKSGDTVG
jgi:RNA polymerase sigma-70 factor (ECF subfamily)